MGRSLAELAEFVGGRAQGDAATAVEGLSTLENAGPGQLSFLTNPRYRRRALASRAGVLLVAPGLEGLDRTLLICEDPYHALTRLMDLFYPPAKALPAGVHPKAEVDPAAEIDPAAHVGPFAVIGPGSSLAAGVVCHAHVTIGSDCRVGPGAVLHPQVVLYDRTEVGARSVIHSGVVLGCDGFGYATHGGEHVKLRQVGSAVIGEDVEIGSNSVVDRGMLESTRIGDGTKIDNLVQVGHNARVGERCLLVAQVGISGSTRLGDGVVMAGQSGTAGHLEIGAGAQVGAKSAVFRSVPAGGAVAGIPAVEMAAWRRQQALVKRLAQMRRRLAALEKRSGGGREGG